jgi:site-specific DNA recombinase
MRNDVMKAVVGYIRVSTEKQSEEGNSLDIQKDEIKNYIKRNKNKEWRLIKIYEDAGRSGGYLERPAFTEMMRDVQARKFDVLIITRLSRFARNARDLLNKIHELQNQEVQLVSIKESLDLTNPYGRFMVIMLGGVAQLERDVIKDQMAEGKLSKWKKGSIQMGQDPFGYKWNKEKKELEIVPEEKEIYLKMVDLYLNHGKSMKDIALILNKEGVKGKRGRGLSSVTISDILKNTIYYGERTQNLYEYEYDVATGKHRRTKKEKPASEHIILEAPAIIDKLTWNRIQKRIEMQKSASKRVSEEAKNYWLRDSLVCGECEASVKPRSGRKNKAGVRDRYYACYYKGTSKKNLELAGRKRCQTNYIKAHQIETMIWIALVRPMHLVLNPEKIVPMFEEKRYDKKREYLEQRIKQAERAVLRKQTVRKNLFKGFEDENFDVDEMAKRLNQNKTEILEAESRLKELKNDLLNLERAKEDDIHYQAFVKKNKSLLKEIVKSIISLPREDKKTLMEASITERLPVYKNPDFGKEHGAKPWKIKRSDIKNIQLNIKTLQEFLDDGKLIKNGSDHPSADDIRRSH